MLIPSVSPVTSCREPWFLCEAHSTMDFDWLERVCDVAMREATDAQARARRAEGSSA